MATGPRRGRWWPDSFSGQLLALLLAGLVLTHAFGLWLLSADAGRIHPRSSLAAAELFVRVYRTVRQLDADTAGRMLDMLSDSKVNFTVVSSPRPLLAGPDGISGTRLDEGPSGAPRRTLDLALGEEDVDTVTAARTAALVSRDLGLGASALRVCAGPECIGDAAASEPRSESLSPVVFEAKLPDGRWLQATAWSELRRRWWWPISFWLQVSLVPIFLAVAVVTGRMLRPWRALVAAANAASRGERLAPLPVTGPREMREVLAAFNETQRRIGRFLDDQTKMLAALSHDFRRPLTSLRLWADLVDDESLRQPMVRTLAEMRTMVDETLALMRDEVALEDTVEVSLRELLDQLIAENAARDHDVAWQTPPQTDFFYRCRPVALKRAFSNILDNAIRHGGKARLAIRHGDHANGRPAITVVIDDDGPGLPAERLATIFEPQGGGTAGEPASASGQVSKDPTSRSLNGPVAGSRSGLGLSIARMFARAHGGELKLQPGPQSRGLRATFVLPVA